MLPAVRPPTGTEAVRLDMGAGGWFHAGVWALTVAGVLLLYDAACQETWPPPLPWLVGTLLVGAGLFNLAEGAVDHHLLGLPHVRDVPAYDWALLLVAGVGPLVAGWLLARATARARPWPPSPWNRPPPPRRRRAPRARPTTSRRAPQFSKRPSAAAARRT